MVKWDTLVEHRWSLRINLPIHCMSLCDQTLASAMVAAVSCVSQTYLSGGKYDATALFGRLNQKIFQVEENRDFEGTVVNPDLDKFWPVVHRLSTRQQVLFCTIEANILK